MKVVRIALVPITCFLFVACEPSESAVTSPPAPDSIGPVFDLSAVTGSVLGEPIGGLTDDEASRFDAGLEEFSEEEEVDEGLGPVFNEAGCAVCHAGPVGGTTGRLETRFGRVNRRGQFDPLAALGGSLIQDQAIGAVESGHEYVAEVVPAEANVIAGRLTTQLFGLGLVDAVPDETFITLARLQGILTPGTAGKPNRVTEIVTGQRRVGRFGWKAQVPTLFQFSADAYLNEMGITSPQFPDESCPNGDCAALVHNPVKELNDDGQDVEAFSDFMTLLAPPPSGPRTLQVVEGSAVFAGIGCASCHTPVLRTGSSPVAALSEKAFQPFSDFLLHDMGRLGDGIVQGEASGREMRTAPLWGAQSRSLFLHDGRATSVEAAILAHDGQGKAARNRFAGLGAQARNALLAFVNSL